MTVKIPHAASYRGDHNAMASTNESGDIVITEIGYYDDEITITRAQLAELGYEPVCQLPRKEDASLELAEKLLYRGRDNERCDECGAPDVSSAGCRRCGVVFRRCRGHGGVNACLRARREHACEKDDLAQHRLEVVDRCATETTTCLRCDAPMQRPRLNETTTCPRCGLSRTLVQPPGNHEA